jgi:hypothetical protein
VNLKYVSHINKCEFYSEQIAGVSTDVIFKHLIHTAERDAIYTSMAVNFIKVLTTSMFVLRVKKIPGLYMSREKCTQSDASIYDPLQYFTQTYILFAARGDMANISRRREYIKSPSLCAYAPNIFALFFQFDECAPSVFIFVSAARNEKEFETRKKRF